VSTYLERARRALRTARSNLNDGDQVAASNRVYYALFDAVRAVLAARGLADVSRIRTHQGITHVFNVTVVRAGLMEEQVARALPRALALRTHADYGSNVEIGRDTVESALAEAARFLEAAERLVEAARP